MPVKPVPDGYATVTPYLCINGVVAAIAWYRKAFGAEERMCMAMPDGKVVHAEIQIGNSVVMMADEHPALEFLAPPTRGGTTVHFALYVPDVDALFARAVAAGAKIQRPLKNQFYGDRSGTVLDPFGHRWTISTHVEDVSPEEMERRQKAAECG